MLDALVIGPYRVPWHVVTYLLAFGTASTMSFRRLVRAGYPAPAVTATVVATVLSGFLGAVGGGRLVEVGNRLVGAAVGPGGRVNMTCIGGLAGAGFAALACCRLLRWPAGRTLDVAFVPVPLAQAINRLGCFAEPCCCGRPTTSWLAVNLPDAAGRWAPRYPAQLISALSDIAIFLTLLAFERWARRGQGRERWPFPGFVALLFPGLYALKRFLVEYLRDEARWLGPLTWAQLASALALAVVLAAVLVRWRTATARRADTGSTALDRA